VSDFARDLPEARGKTNVGGFTPDLERIASLAPDLVVASRDGTDKAAYDRLVSLQYRVVVTSGATLEGVLDDIGTVARAIGEEARGRALVADLSRRIAAAEKRRPAEGATVLVVIWPEPPIVAGRKTFIGDLLSRAGLRNVVPESAGEWPRVSHETIAGWSPSIVIRPDTPENEGAFATAFGSDPRWAVAFGGKKGNVVKIPGSFLERPGPRLVDALERLVSLTRP